VTDDHHPSPGRLQRGLLYSLARELDIPTIGWLVRGGVGEPEADGKKASEDIEPLNALLRPVARVGIDKRESEERQSYLSAWCQI
jgi:hypothetical protein